LFCVHHDDAYPRGNEQMGPEASLKGRNIGMDFDGIDGWRMYHGDVVPGFPQHPHRGFETVTIVQRGFIDHADSLGATARFGQGDVQWLTAGQGIVHSEMFPLLSTSSPNPLELFQIWLNLPSAGKMVPAHFSMLWDHAIPKQETTDTNGKRTQVTVVAGSFGELTPPRPPPRSWASHADSDVAIWMVSMQAGARWTLPDARPGTHRTLYFYSGNTLTVADSEVPVGRGLALVPDAVELTAGSEDARLLLLQGRPIGEPVAHYGPFVMNTRQELEQAISDYRRTQYGGWPWPSDGPVHEREAGRFARHADGRVERIDEGVAD
jgi:hypothetical protein